MKKQIKTMLVGLSLIAFSSVVMADTFNSSNVAVVDVNAVVANSVQVQTLKKEQQQKMEELQKWLTTARADVEKQKTKEGKEKLLKKYNEDFAKKQDAIKKNYATKLQAIDQSITKTIATKARLNNYSVVLTKNSVLYGGTDITQEVIKSVK